MSGWVWGFFFGLIVGYALARQKCKPWSKMNRKEKRVYIIAGITALVIALLIAMLLR